MSSNRRLVAAAAALVACGGGPRPPRHRDLPRRAADREAVGRRAPDTSGRARRHRAEAERHQSARGAGHRALPDDAPPVPDDWFATRALAPDDVAADFGNLDDLAWLRADRQ